MKIVSIAVIPNPNADGYAVTYGLGEDNKVYRWNVYEGTWDFDGPDND